MKLLLAVFGACLVIASCSYTTTPESQPEDDDMDRTGHRVKNLGENLNKFRSYMRFKRMQAVYERYLEKDEQFQTVMEYFKSHCVDIVAEIEEVGTVQNLSSYLDDHDDRIYEARKKVNALCLSWKPATVLDDVKATSPKPINGTKTSEEPPKTEDEDTTDDPPKQENETPTGQRKLANEDSVVVSDNFEYVSLDEELYRNRRPRNTTGIKGFLSESKRQMSRLMLRKTYRRSQRNAFFKDYIQFMKSNDMKNLYNDVWSLPALQEFEIFLKKYDASREDFVQFYNAYFGIGKF